MKIILIGGGSFQGKSLVALEVAYRFKIPTILCSDTIRSLLHVLYPEDSVFFTSTYLMKHNNLKKQMKYVSETTMGMLEIYERRGESLVLEGMHFSNDFIRYLSRKTNAIAICLDNKLSFLKRIINKSQTRTRVEFVDPNSGDIVYGEIKDENVGFTPYIKHQERINEIHNMIVALHRKWKSHIVTFEDINKAIENVVDIVGKWIDTD